MSLNVPPPPKGGVKIISAAIANLRVGPGAAANVMAETAPQDLTVAAPHPVYFVELTALARGELLSAVKLAGWRYILLDGERPLAAAELTVKGGDQKLEFSHMNHGPFVGSTVEGIGLAEKLDEVRVANYELRLLDIPSLYIVALWLSAEQNLIIPLPPCPRMLTAYRTYTEEQFIIATRNEAIARLGFERDGL
jgi:hypothetical protein